MAYEIATALGAPLDVFVVRKLGVPRVELAMGAITSGGVVVVNDDVARGLSIPADVIQRIAEQEGRELLRREQAYRGGRTMPDLAGKTVIVVDDGLATDARGDHGAAGARAPAGAANAASLRHHRDGSGPRGRRPDLVGGVMQQLRAARRTARDRGAVAASASASR